MRLLLIFCIWGLAAIAYSEDPVADTAAEPIADPEPIEDDFDVGRALEDLLNGKLTLAV